MIYRLRLYSDGDMYVFRQTSKVTPFGPRFLTKMGNYVQISEDGVKGIMQGSFPIDSRALFKLAVLNNFLDKLKEMCSTDLNTKQ